MTVKDEAVAARHIFNEKVFSVERERIGNRRRALGLGDPPASPQECIGLALSGGGIRSATLSLGVLQSMARSGLLQKVDYLSTVSGGGYIGSYFGSLFLPEALRQGREASLAQTDFEQSCREAYAAIGCSGVAGRSTEHGVGTDAAPSSDGGNADARSATGWTPAESIEWLRSNGRYLTPRGAGDLLFAIAMQVRNWAAVQYVVGLMILSPLLTFAMLRAWMMYCPWWRSVEAKFLPTAQATMYWSPGWLWVGLYALLGVVPPALAYWLVHARIRNRKVLSRLPLWHELGILVVLAIGLGWSYWVYRVQGDGDLPMVFWIGVAYTLVSIITIVVFVAGWIVERRKGYPNGTLDLKSLRTRFTKWLKSAVLLLLVGAGLALLGSLGQTVYAYIQPGGGQGLSRFFTLLAGSGSMSALLVTVARQLFKLVGSGQSRRHPLIPFNALAALGAIVLLLLTGVIWAVVVQAVLWTGGPPPAVPSDVASAAGGWVRAPMIGVSVWQAPDTETLYGLGCLAADSCDAVASVLLESPVRIASGWITAGWLALLALGATTGLFLNFLNMSSLHQLYAARLARAYLGATNRDRFDAKRDKPRSADGNAESGETIAEEGEERRSRRFADRMRRGGATIARMLSPDAETAVDSVTNPLPTDSIALGAYYRSELAAPVHLINMTVNRTRPRKTELVQRDRKGTSMAIGPGFTIVERSVFARSDANGHLTPADEHAASIAHPGNPGREKIAAEQLDLGDWCAISGAAFSTGLGTNTSLGFSLLAALANVRLGYWWYAGVERRDPWRFLLTYRYLLAELLADFEGTSQRFWFLTDGGHFENTGVYELVRRRVGIIVLCDNGCDTAYKFDDLGNLARKIRTDFGAEMTEASDDERTRLFAGDDRRARLFGTAREFANEDLRGGKCALLYEIRYTDANGIASETDRSLLIVLKPNIVEDAPLDLLQYKWAHEDFPNQTTLDQFFDEAQWESYRMLGQVIAREVLTEKALAFDGWHAALTRSALQLGAERD